MTIREYEGVTRRQARLDVRPRWWAEILTILIFYELYSLVRNSQEATAAHAFRNAETLVDIEQAVRLYFEHGFQQLFLHSTQFVRFLNVYYGTAHFIVTAYVLGWLWWRYPSSYRDARWVLAATTGLALIGFVFYPVMPPRLMPHHANSYEYIDTLRTIGGLWNFDSGPIARLSNPYAAMPSLHFGWSTWCALVVWPRLRSWPIRALAVTHPVLTFVAIVATANHWWIDALAGGALLAIGWVLGKWLAERWRRLVDQWDQRRAAET
jgi:hypothetical protein